MIISANDTTAYEDSDEAWIPKHLRRFIWTKKDMEAILNPPPKDVVYKFERALQEIGKKHNIDEIVASEIIG